MAIRNDYLMDMIARFAESIARALARGSEGDPTQGVSAYEEVVGEVLDMDAPVALALSAPSLVTMMQISAVDERLAAYAAFCLDSIAQAYELQGDPSPRCARHRPPRSARHTRLRTTSSAGGQGAHLTGRIALRGRWARHRARGAGLFARRLSRRGSAVCEHHAFVV